MGSILQLLLAAALVFLVGSVVVRLFRGAAGEGGPKAPSDDDGPDTRAPDA